MSRIELNKIKRFKGYTEYYNLDKNTSKFGVVKLLMNDYQERHFGSMVTKRIINDILDGNWDKYYNLLPDVDWGSYDVENLSISVRLHNILNHFNIKTISEASSLTYEDTKTMKGFGVKNWEELQNQLMEVGV